MIATLKAVNLAASTEHTPGPWVAMGRSVFAGKDCIGICDTDNAPSLRMEANARVMAAAPKMLAALKRFIADYDEENPPDDMPNAGCIECTAGTVPNRLNTGLCKYHQAREAIAKAEGGAA